MVNNVKQEDLDSILIDFAHNIQFVKSSDRYYESADKAKDSIQKFINSRVLESEIALLRETAEGFQSVLKPEFAKGGQAAINALIKMAKHKEAELQAQLTTNKSKE